MSDEKRETLGDSGKEHCNHCAGEALVDPSVNDQLQSMRRDAARYEFLREYWTRIITHTNVATTMGPVAVDNITVMESRYSFDPQSLDQAIDAAMEREKEHTVRICECAQGVADHQRPGCCARCGRPLREAPTL